MQVALSSNDKKRCIAWKTEKGHGPFICPGCFGEVILKKGKIREHHFAHKPPFDCLYGRGETQLHYKCKRKIYEALSNHPKVKRCEIEKQFDGLRADVYVELSAIKIAIEVQKTNIDIDTIARKSLNYSKLGIFTLWLSPYDAPEKKWHEGEAEWICRPKEWEKYIHAMYYGRFYYWVGELSVKAFHFDRFQIYVEEKEWFNEYGNEQYGGGYFKNSRAHKLPVPYSKNLHILDNFVPRKRNQFTSAKWSVHECNLWIDSLKPWWVKIK